MRSDSDIRIAVPADLPGLVRELGQQRYFADRLRRQRHGHGLLLVAWLDAAPVGDVYVRFEPADEPELRERMPGVPLLQHLEVRAGLRNRRIGSRLIRAAERVLRERGHSRLALGVALDNHDAARLYRRHGYREWLHPPIPTSSEEVRPDGSTYRRRELCQILVKNLAGPGR